MSNILTIAKKELNAYFNSPIAYLLVSAYLALSGGLFFGSLFIERSADMRQFFSLAPVLFLILTPMLTMRLLAEERAQGTLESLLVLPVTDWEVVLGKFTAAIGMLGTIMLLTFAFPITVSMLGPLDWGTTIASYIGMLLMCGSYAAIGLMTSAFTKHQLIAGVVALVIGLGNFFVGSLAPMLPPWLQSVVTALSIHGHFQNIARGVLDSRDVLFYLSVIGGSLLITQAKLESRRWV